MIAPASEDGFPRPRSPLWRQSRDDFRDPLDHLQLWRPPKQVPGLGGHAGSSIGCRLGSIVGHSLNGSRGFLMARQRALGLGRSCPRCEIPDHLHIELLVGNNGRFATLEEEADGTLVLSEDVTRPLVLEATITCCACDFYEERRLRVER